MQSQTLIPALGFIAVIIVLAALGWWIVQRRRTSALRDHFGDEYDRTLEAKGERAAAERDLEDRERRVAALEIVPFTAQDRDHYAAEWRDVKALFVDSPVEATLRADRVLGEMMGKQGYPMTDFEHRYEDLTVDHAHVARHYRDGHTIVNEHGHIDGSTEDLRQAMKHYEALYDELMAEGTVREHDTHAPVRAAQR